MCGVCACVKKGSEGETERARETDRGHRRQKREGQGGLGFPPSPLPLFVVPHLLLLRHVQTQYLVVCLCDHSLTISQLFFSCGQTVLLFEFATRPLLELVSVF